MPTLTTRADTPPDGQFADEFDGLIAATTLLQQPRLAREYVYLCYHGPATMQELIDALDLARATAYDDVDRLESLAVVGRDERTRPHDLTAAAFAFTDDDQIAITPTVLHAIGRSVDDDDVASLRNQHGTARLVRALQLTGEYFGGQQTQRMVANELGVSPAEGMAIVYALEQVVAAGREHDPYFDRLFPDIADDIETDISLSETQSTDGAIDENV
jgi:hypothetical protein